MENISILNFSSVLEILTVYYVGTATSENLRNLFGINETFGKTLKSNDLFKVLKNLPVENLKVASDKISNTEIIKKAKEAEYYSNVYKIYLDIIKLKERKYLFLDSAHLFNCLKPFYIFFGILAFGLLLLGGISQTWQRTMSMPLINLVSILSIVILLFRLTFRLRPPAVHWGPIKSFVASAFIVILLISIPESISKLLPFSILPSHAISNKFILLSYIDFHIIFCLCLLFVPLMIHMFCLILIMKGLYRIKKQMIKYGLLNAGYDENDRNMSDDGNDFLSEI